jgi:hypothetical protein
VCLNASAVSGVIGIHVLLGYCGFLLKDVVEVRKRFVQDRKSLRSIITRSNAVEMDLGCLHKAMIEYIKGLTLG